MSVVRAGSCVLLDINNGEHFVFSRLTPSATVKLGKLKYSLAPVIGCSYGSQFEPRKSSLEQITRAETNETRGDDDEEDEDKNLSMKDNRSLVDDNTAQTLSADEINSMKREGSSGREIVNALIANSVSFESKTAFSQEKYKRKKQKKYSPRIIIRRPTARSVCEAYFSKTPAKIGYLRVDSLSVILSLSNSGENSNVLVLDMLGGLLTAAVAERLSGFGTVCNVYYTQKPPSVDIVGLFNFDSATSSRIFRVPLSKLLESQQSSLECKTPVVNDDKNMETVSCTEELDPSTDAQLEAAVSEGTETVLSGDIEGEPAVSTTQAKQRMIYQPSDNEVFGWVKTGFSSLIVGALGVDPLKTLQQLLPFLSPSSPFVIYHTYLQPLSECMLSLQKERMAVGLQLLEPWMREYQVLPSRTHPQMQMSSTGGYILSGIKALPQ